MQQGDHQITNPDRHDIATEVLSSAFRVLQAVGFSEQEIAKLLRKRQSTKDCVARFGSTLFEPFAHLPGDLRHPVGKRVATVRFRCA